MDTESENAPLLGVMVGSNHSIQTPNGVGYGTRSHDWPIDSVVAVTPSSARRNCSSIESVTLSWENVNAFVKESQKGSKGLLCCRSSSTSEKQILYNG